MWIIISIAMFARMVFLANNKRTAEGQQERTWLLFDKNVQTMASFNSNNKMFIHQLKTYIEMRHFSVNHPYSKAGMTCFDLRNHRQEAPGSIEETWESATGTCFAWANEKRWSVKMVLSHLHQEKIRQSEQQTVIFQAATWNVHMCIIYIYIVFFLYVYIYL